MKFNPNEHIVYREKQHDDFYELRASLQMDVKSTIATEKLDALPDRDKVIADNMEAQKRQIIMYFYGDIIDALMELRSMVSFGIKDFELNKSARKKIETLLGRLSE